MNFNTKLHEKLIKEFEDHLNELQKERKNRPDTIDFKGQNLPAWAVFEIIGMFDKVNQARKKLELDQCQLDQIVLADKSAAGHSDYSHKFSLYCAEIVQKDQ